MDSCEKFADKLMSAYDRAIDKGIQPDEMREALCMALSYCVVQIEPEHYAAAERLLASASRQIVSFPAEAEQLERGALQ